ncbi:hypothetical protein CPB86DRAFT_297910 [Serendipita vermifera]|nr:hypothetical protein CPB86DRAFT_297910 [Serendipita vermifera]
MTVELLTLYRSFLIDYHFDCSISHFRIPVTQLVNDGSDCLLGDIFRTGIICLPITSTARSRTPESLLPSFLMTAVTISWVTYFERASSVEYLGDESHSLGVQTNHIVSVGLSHRLLHVANTNPCHPAS